MSELHEIAKVDKAWADAKAAGYAEDGVQVPEPIRRLRALATLVCAAQDAATATGANDSAWQKATECRTPEEARRAADAALLRHAAIDEWRDATGCDTPADAQKMIVDLSNRVGDTLTILREGSLWFAGRAAHISGRDLAFEIQQLAGSVTPNFQAPAGTGDGLTKVAVLPQEGRVEVSEGPGATFQDASEGRPAPVVATERRAIAFRPGLVLVKRDAPHHRVLFSNSKGPWIVQTITGTGDLGPDTAAHEGTWFTDTWEEGPAYVAPKKGEQATTHCSGPVAENPAGPSKKVADWNPDEAYIEERVKTFCAKLAEEGKSMVIDAQLIRSLIARFKAEHGQKEPANIGSMFHHYGMRQLKG